MTKKIICDMCKKEKEKFSSCIIRYKGGKVIKLTLCSDDTAKLGSLVKILIEREGKL